MTNPKLKLQIAHQVPGRVRMKIPTAKGNPELLREIGDAFGVIPGIERIIVNPVTGSVVLHYDTEQHDAFHGGLQRHYDGGRRNGPHRPDTEVDALARKIEDEAEYLAQNSKSARAVVDFCKRVDHEIKRSTNNNIDLKILLALALVGVTVFEIGAAAPTPVWVTLGLFAMNHFIEMHHINALRAPATAPIVVKSH